MMYDEDEEEECDTPAIKQGCAVVDQKEKYKKKDNIPCWGCDD